MATVDRQATIAGSPDAVWAVLSDFAAISGWAANVDHSCLMSAQSDGVGAVRRIQSGRTTVIETIERWEPGVALAYSITGLPPIIRSVTNTWLLTPGVPSITGSTTASTTVTLITEIDAGPRPPQRAIAKIVGRKLAQGSEQMLDGLAARMRATQETPT